MRKATALLILGLLLSLLGYGAKKKFVLTNTSTTPAARGEVEVSTDKKNGNTKVKIKVEHLAPPGDLTPPRIGYLVWFKSAAALPSRKGS